MSESNSMNSSIAAILAELTGASLLLSVADSAEEQQAFVDCDLASLAEHRLGEISDPRCLDDTTRAGWLARAMREGSVLLKPKAHPGRHCFWLLADGARVGTIALSNPYGDRSLWCSSLYVLPGFRGRGLGARAMTALIAAADKHKFALRLSTEWAWQNTLKFYRRLGGWIYMWKRDLDFIWPRNCPTPRVCMAPTEASLTVRVDDTEYELARANRRNGQLEFEDCSSRWEHIKTIQEASYLAPSTLALELAMCGWPLVRSATEWNESAGAHAGSPEALGYKIALWEFEQRSRGWLLKTPHIEGLDPWRTRR